MITRWRSCSDVIKKPGSFYIPASPALACGLHPHDGKTVAASLGSECVFQAGRQKNFLSNLGFLFGKESPLLGLSVCILLTKLCQWSPLAARDSGNLCLLFPVFHIEKGREEVDWDGSLASLQYLSKYVINSYF